MAQEPGDKHFSYLPGLDGLRALAVAAVLLYHAGISPVAGGFLGVEVFFVISGYLITCVLLSDRERDGRINIGRFWFRRARRLLPALFVLLLGVLGAAVLFYPGEVTELLTDTLAALGYTTNWYLISDSKPYFEAVGRPPLLQHLWSLAIEEQFYLVWPLVLALLVGRIHRAGIVFLLVALAAASTVLMAVLWQPGTEPTRVYYGTDTRAAGLLIGAALAFVWAPWSVARPKGGRRLAIGLDMAGIIAIAALVYLHLQLDQYEPFLYRGGFALVGILTALLIAVSVHPSAHLGRLLGRQPLRWLGTRSYAVYLWHWPVFMLTRPNADVSMDGAELLALRLGITFVLAEISYRLVEQPVRSGALGRAWRAYRDSRGRRRWIGGVRWGAPLGAAACAASVLAVFAISAQPPEPPPYLSVRAVNIVSPVTEADAAETNAPVSDPTGQDQTAAIPAPGVSAPGSEGAPAPGAAGSQPAPAYGRASGVTVTALGDSVMVGAAPELARAIPGAEVNAEIGRQASAALDLLRQRSAAGGLGDAVVIHIGNNGTFNSGQFDGMMQALANRRVVVFVNIKVPRAWEGPNNGVISGGVGRYANAALVDWYGASANRPELFYSDGIHLRPEGVQLYTALITQELAKHPPPPPPGATPAEAPPPADAPPPGENPPPSEEPPPAGEPQPVDTPTPNAAPTPPVVETPTPTPPPPPPTDPPTPDPTPAPEPPP